jgi:uncharacterized protein YukE
VTSFWLPEIPGDPAGMRALAAWVRGDAATIGTLASELSATVAGVTFEGPAATEFFERMRATELRCSEAADGLLGVAALLETSADEVEAAQRERLRRMEEMRQAEIERRQAAAQGAP